MRISKKKKRLLILIILIIFIWAPWMTNDWCKNRLFNREFDSLGPINESWEVEANWIPFGRYLNVLRLKPERPQPLTIGSYGFDICMIFTGDTFFFIGR